MSEQRDRQIAADYQRGLGTMAEIAAQYQVFPNTVYRAVKKYGSPPPQRRDEGAVTTAARAVVEAWARDAHGRHLSRLIAQLQQVLEEHNA